MKINLKNKSIIVCKDNNNRVLFSVIIEKLYRYYGNPYTIKFTMIIEHKILDDLPKTIEILGSKNCLMDNYGHRGWGLVFDQGINSHYPYLNEKPNAELFEKMVDVKNSDCFRYKFEYISEDTMQKTLDCATLKLEQEMNNLLNSFKKIEDEEEEFNKELKLQINLVQTDSNKTFEIYYE